MELKTFIEKGYSIREFVNTVVEYEVAFDDEIPKLDALEASNMTGDVVNEYANDEFPTYSIVGEGENILFDQMDFEELKARIEEME